MDMQAMTLHPLTTVNHPAHRTYPWTGITGKDLLNRMHGAHLVGHRAYTANTRHDIRNFMVAASFKEFFKQPRRLIDTQLQSLDAVITNAQSQRALAFNTGKGRDVDVDMACLSPSAIPLTPSPP